MRRWILTGATLAVLFGAWVGAAYAQGNPQFTLTGVVFVEGGAGRAWLQEPTLTQNQVITLRVGETVGPYRLAKVLNDRVELEGPSGKFSVLLAGVSGPAIANRPTSDVPQRGAPAALPAENAPRPEIHFDPARKEPLRKHTFTFEGLPALLNPGNPGR